VERGVMEQYRARLKEARLERPAPSNSPTASR
jgi:hypothetical protein